MRKKSPMPPLLIALMFFTLSMYAATAQDTMAAPAERLGFKEIWAYLMRGEETELTGSEPITDIGYFGASLTKEGRISETIRRPDITLKDGLRPRIHLVVADISNYALMHFSLDPEYGVRPLLLDDICRVAEGFDGVQIDFEAVSRDDAEYFFDFLKELRSRLPTGMSLSIAVPARTEPRTDAYDYSRIAPLVDRIVIMAYDEHWSGSLPGPVASLPWCSQVVDYAEATLENAKIIMGLPLYGRAWQDKKLARALRFKSVQDILAEKQSQTSYSSDLGAYFEYSENVVVRVFYDDYRSLMDKLQLYKAKNVSAVSFWRIGQGPPELWSSIDNTASRTISVRADDAAKPRAGSD